MNDSCRFNWCFLKCSDHRWLSQCQELTWMILNDFSFEDFNNNICHAIVKLFADYFLFFAANWIRILFEFIQNQLYIKYIDFVFFIYCCSRRILNIQWFSTMNLKEKNLEYIENFFCEKDSIRPYTVTCKDIF